MDIVIYSSRRGELIVELQSEFSHRNVSELPKVLSKIETMADIDTLTIDMAKTRWVDSIGLGMLYNIYLLHNKTIPRFQIINASGLALKSIETGQLGRQYYIIPGQAAGSSCQGGVV